ncbi:MAG TPA: hypothetical protein VEW07_06345 [Solirubrobacterales bacterium]|nr:hypothetical protein [Solirubrobacterales bacterium]
MNFIADWWQARAERRVDVESRDGKVTFNHLQQSEPEPVVDDGRPATETTDPKGITS